MSSLRRIISSRANGARSKGPVTPEGKKRSAANAVRHGLLARHAVLPNESRDGFDKVMSDHLARFGPVDGVEIGILEEMVVASWHTRRAWAVENELLAAAVAAQPAGEEVARIAAAFTQLAAQPQLALLHRYQARLHRMHQRALYNLLLLRSVAPQPAPRDPGPPRLAAPDPANVL